MRISHKPAATVTNKPTGRRCLWISERNNSPGVLPLFPFLGDTGVCGDEVTAKSCCMGK